MSRRRSNSNSNNSNDFYLQLYSTSPAPKRDYHGLTVTDAHVTLNSWDISRGPHVFPRKRKQSLEDFNGDRCFQNEIRSLFGSHTVDYILRLARGERSLCCLPESLVLYIVKKLAVNDILNLRQTSKIFFEACYTITPQIGRVTVQSVPDVQYESRMESHLRENVPASKQNGVGNNVVEVYAEATTASTIRKCEEV